MRSLLATLLLIAMVLTAGCIHDSDAGQRSSVAYSVESQGTQTGVENQQFHVISSDAQYASLLSSVLLSGAIPTVDFGNLSLISVFLGNHIGCLGDTLSVNSVIETEKTITLSISRTIGNPPPNTACVAVVRPGGPYLLVSIPKSDKLISLQIE